jgi:diphthamide synthase (EF-2-diphthine--ammonia ligase)
MAAKRWTKTAIRSLCAQIDSFWLEHRLGLRQERVPAFVDFIRENRLAIVVGGLRSFRGLLDSRMVSQRETAEHARTSGVWGSSTAEIVERFMKLAAGTGRDLAKIDALIARVEAEGLPDEVIGYLPEALREH